MNTGKDMVERIDALLAEQKVKRRELAEYAGISLQAFTNWASRGNFPAADVALKIAEFLHVSVEYVISGKDSAKPDRSAAIKKIERGLEELKQL